jgi:hypothetical protein
MNTTNTKSRWPAWTAAAVALVAITVAAVAFYPQVTQAAAPVTTEAATTLAAWGPRGDRDEQLAEALGITAEELEAAREQVFADQIAQAVEEGTLTQEEADLMLAQQKLAEYMREQRQAEVEAQVTAAVEAGVITQEEADLILSNPGPGGFGHGMRGGFGDFDRGMGGHGHGGMRGGMRGFDRGMPGGWFGMPEGETEPQSFTAPVVPGQSL